MISGIQQGDRGLLASSNSFRDGTWHVLERSRETREIILNVHGYPGVNILKSGGETIQNNSCTLSGIHQGCRGLLASSDSVRDHHYHLMQHCEPSQSSLGRGS